MAIVNAMYALLIARAYDSASPITNGSHDSIKEYMFF